MACFFSFLCLPQWACTRLFPHSNIPTVPPAQNFKWDISQKNSRIEQVFFVKEYRTYCFSIGFSSSVAWDYKEHQEWRKDPRVWDFYGEAVMGTYKNANGVLTKVMDKTGILIPVVDPSVKGGVIIPAHLQVQSLDETDRVITTLLDATVNAQAILWYAYVVPKLMAMVKLRPGKYRVTATTLQETILLEGMGAYLNIAFHPNSTTFNDDE